jgi:hypothetical protein
MISFVALVFTVYFFFGLATITKLIALFFLLLTILYTLPFFPNRTNARNWAGLKIYIVAFCWVGVTVFLPIINTDAKLNSIFYLYSTQRFLIVFILILLFEIIDIKNDDPHLKTLPQQIGVKNTKNLGYLLLMVYCGLSFLYSNFGFPLLELELSFWVTLIIALFLFFANENRSKYYTLFWVESIPILWLLLLFWN